METREVDDAVPAIMALAEQGFELLVVGRGRRPALLLAGLAAQRTPFRAYYRPRSLGAASTTTLVPQRVLGRTWGLLGTSSLLPRPSPPSLLFSSTTSPWSGLSPLCDLVARQRPLPKVALYDAYW